MYAIFQQISQFADKTHSVNTCVPITKIISLLYSRHTYKYLFKNARKSAVHRHVAGIIQAQVFEVLPTFILYRLNMNRSINWQMEIYFSVQE